MTLAAIWLGDSRLYAIADTRFSRSRGNVLTEHGPKLLPLNVSCKQPGPSGFFDKEVFRTTVGYAYAGATLPALSTHAFAATVCQNLIGAPNAPIPLLDEIAAAVAEIAARYMREVGQLSGMDSLFTALVFGYCAGTQKYRGFELRPVIGQGPLRVEIAERDLYAQHSLAVIGSRPDLLRDRITAMSTDLNAAAMADLPRRALEALIRENADETIGGALQYGWATPTGFEPVAHAILIEPPLPSGRNVALTVLGFDINEFDHVGAYRFNVIGRA